MKRPSHATVVAYLALFVAIGGSAYAVSKIGSADIKNRSIQGKDVADATLSQRQIDATKLSGPVAVGSETSDRCGPTTDVPLDCPTATLRTRKTSGLLIIATGLGIGGGVCETLVDGGVSNGTQVSEGQAVAVTKVTSPLPPGRHTVGLRCGAPGQTVGLEHPTIAAIAVTPTQP